MDKRKEKILHILIEEHINSGIPVSSNVLVDKYKIGVSPATVRNEMAVLEEEGFIIQPHVSAGRIPTEKAYKSYVESLSVKKLKNSEENLIDSCIKEKNEISFKETAKNLCQISGNAVFWAFHRNNLYYTGISNLLQQPEFREFNLIYNISTVIDKIDEIVDEIFDKISIGEHVFIGSDNPFGSILSTILLKYKLNENIGLLGVLGPIRMNYEKNIALINFINKKIINK